MNKHEYPNLGETLYEEVLPNGLSVLVAVKPGFCKNAAFSPRATAGRTAASR